MLMSDSSFVARVTPTTQQHYGTLHCVSCFTTIISIIISTPRPASHYTHLPHGAHLLVHQPTACVAPAVGAPAGGGGALALIPLLQATNNTSLHAHIHKQKGFGVRRARAP